MDAESHPGQVPMKVPSRRALRIAAACLAGAALLVLVVMGTIRILQARGVAQWTSHQATIPVMLADVDFSASARALTLPGQVQAFQKAAIYARVNGYLKSWQQDIGARVTAGQQLAVIDTPDLDQQLDQARADLASARAAQRLANLTSSRWTALVDSEAVAQQAADEKVGDAQVKNALMNAANANMRRLATLSAYKRITAPFDGIVTARNTDVGALINAGAGGQQLFEVSDLSKVRIYVQTPQSFAPQLYPGLTATFEVPQFPGRTFTAKLVTTSQAIGAGSGSLLVELQADNPDGLLQAGSYCDVHFKLDGQPGAARIPATALAPTDKGAQVAVIGPDNKAVFKTVQLGRDFGDTVEVVAGLSPKDRVIDNPPETLSNGDLVRLVTPPRGSAQAAP
jgi:RND family efflux transporter MFP subunit